MIPIRIRDIVDDPKQIKLCDQIKRNLEYEIAREEFRKRIGVVDVSYGEWPLSKIKILRMPIATAE